LRIVGQGIALPHWKEMVKQLGIEDRVEFTGAVPRDVLMNYYADASILVFPALRDSGGSALLEAMLLGMPILTFDWGGPGEMVDSSSAIVVRPESQEQVVSEIRSKLLAFFAHPETAVEMCRSARMRALDGFQWHSKANVVHEIYQDLVDQKK
jgi:glycosyltransferase involved in cell wall biosynthesis